MRYVSWLLSILLHALACMVLIQVVNLPQPEMKEIMELDLTKMEEPKEIIPVPAPQPPPLLPPEPEQPPGPVAALPLPLDKTIVLDDTPPSPEAPAPHQAEPPASTEQTALPSEPDIVEISPVKTKEPEPVAQEPPALAPDGLPERIEVRKDDTIAHRGAEARFGRVLMADYYSYSDAEFSGQFTTKDNRTISIIDARKTKYGRFLIYDSKNKTLRRLKQAGKYNFTIGPSLYADEPVTGCMVFFAKDDRIERFILMTDDDRIAHYPNKVHIREEDASFTSPQGTLAGSMSMPPYGDNHPGVVFVHGNACVAQGLIQGFTRSLAAHKLATLAFTPLGCSDTETSSETNAELVTDTAAALDYFTGLPQIGKTRTGLWGNGPGVPLAIRAALHPGTTSPAFLVCLLDDTIDPKTMPSRSQLTGLTIPTLWLITGHKTAAWRPLIKKLERLRDNDKRPFSIVVAPLKPSKDVLDATGDQSGWVELVTEDHARLAASWIQRQVQ